MGFYPVCVIHHEQDKIKWFDLTGCNIKGDMISGCKDIGIDTLAFVTIELNSFLVCCFMPCYHQKMKLY